MTDDVILKLYISLYRKENVLFLLGVWYIHFSMGIVVRGSV